jgi:ribonuclease BN (tRNA processing enzyme)
VSVAIEVLSSEAGRSSAYLLRYGGTLVLVDCGPGAAVALARRGLLEQIDAVLVTHQHADHLADLIGLAYARRFPDPLPAVPFYAPAATLDAVAALDELFAVPTLPAMGRTIAASFELMVLPGDGRPIAVGDGLTVAGFDVHHAVPSTALRFRSPTATVTFSSDTGPCDGVRAAADGADLFLCEATYLQATTAQLEGHGHLTPELAAGIAAAGGVGRLALTHLSRSADASPAAMAAGRHFDAARLEVATAGTTLQAGR